MEKSDEMLALATLYWVSAIFTILTIMVAMVGNPIAYPMIALAVLLLLWFAFKIREADES